jgi:hypothetical protein
MIRRILKTEQHEHHKNTKGQTRTYNMMHKILKTEQHEHNKHGLNMWALITIIFILIHRNIEKLC